MAYDNRRPQSAYGKGQGKEDRSLPPGYLKGGYFENDPVSGKPVLRREYIVGYSKMIADALDDRDKNKSSQLRKFYDYSVRIRSTLERNGSFSEVEAELARLIPFAEYARTKGNVTDLFVEFIRKNVDAIHNENDFYAFVKHFEAVIAYLKKT